jgi:nucleoside-diphosphate kinase
MERTFVMIKPDAVQRNLVGEIIKRFEHKGLKMAGMKFIKTSKELAEELYEVHQGKHFYEGLVELATKSPTIVMVWEGSEAVKVARKLIGATQPREAEPGTIRGDYGMGLPENIIHGSDSVENAKKEMEIFFKPEELADYEKNADVWLGKD